MELPIEINPIPVFTRSAIVSNRIKAGKNRQGNSLKVRLAFKKPNNSLHARRLVTINTRSQADSP